jgi:protein SCO1/2
VNAGTRRLAAVVSAAAVALLLVAGAWAVFIWRGGGEPMPTLPAGQALEAAQLEALAALPDFSLEHVGAPITNADLRGRWAFVFFGYTNCPNACPATLAILNHVQEALHARGIEPPRTLFVSVDPRRDTPQVVDRYASAFGSDTTGATGSDAALHGLLAFFGITVARNDSADKANYTVDHTTNFFLVTPDGRWLATFAPADDADTVLADTSLLMRMPLPAARR